MTTFTTTNSQLESLYVGYFGRAADPAGLQYWTNQLNAGTMTLANIAASFAVSSEAITKYPYLASPTISDPTTFVQSVYQQLFGHTADAAGAAYWTAQLNASKGSPSVVGQMILNIISGATGTDDTVIRNRVDVAQDFTKQASDAGTTFNAAAAAQSSAEIATVTDTAASVTAAKAATTAYIATAPGPQQNFTLGVDTLTSSAQNANFNAQLIFNSGTGTLAQSLQTGDSAVDTAPLTGTGLSNGGTFTAMLNSAAVTPLVTLQGIPTHSVTSIAAGSGYTGGTTGITGLVTLNNNGSTASLTIGSAGAGIDKGGVAGTTTTGATLLSTVNVNGVTAGSTTVLVNTAALAGAADILNINAAGTFGATGALNTVSVKNDTAVAGAAANTYETINVSAAAATFMNLADGASGILSTTTLNVTGAGATTLGGGGIAENFSLLKTINASTQTGGVTVTGLASGATGLLAGAVLTSFKGGTGADSVDLSFMTAAQLQAITATNLDGGTARDTLVLSNAELTGTGTVNQTGFEIISSTALTGTMDYSKWGTGIDTLAVTGIAASQVAAFTINNLVSGFTTTLGTTNAGSGFTFTWNAAGTGLTDALTITQTGNGTAIPGHITTGFEVVNETINNTAGGAAFTYQGLTGTPSGGGSVVHNLIDNYSAAGLTITAESVGAGGSLIITGAASPVGGITFSSAPVAGTVNASGWGTGLAAATTGISYSAAATNGQSFLGSAGADTFLGAAAADTISTGAGNDVIVNMANGVGGVGVFDQIAGGSGVDQVTIRGAVASGALPGLYSTVTSYTDMTVGTGAVGTTDFITLSATTGNYAPVTQALRANAAVAQGAWVVQSLTSANGANAISNNTAAAGATLIKLTTGVAAGATLQATFNSAIGTTTVTGITKSKSYFFTMYDTTNSKMDVGIVSDSTTNTTINTGDAAFLIASVSMSAADYANITANHFSLVAA